MLVFRLVEEDPGRLSVKLSIGYSGGVQSSLHQEEGSWGSGRGGLVVGVCLQAWFLVSLIICERAGAFHLR